MTPSLEYRPEIDGLRALAVVIVTLYHFDVPGFTGGYIGVDVFFVISGYLITSIILGELRAGTFTLRHFFLRRVRRIFPALFAVTLACIPPALLFLVPRDLEDFGKSVVSIGFFFQNFLFHSQAVYFGGPSELKPLLHTWSLAVEEQFYLLFPLLCVLIVKWRLNFSVVFSVLLLASLVFAEWYVRYDAAGAFFLLPSRWWELMLGALIAVLNIRRLPVPQALEVVGVGFILLALTVFDKQTRFPGISALLPTMGTALLIISMQPGGLVHWLFTRKPIVHLGLISYSLYLWHFPIAAYAKRLIGRDFFWQEQLGLVALSVGLAVLSWRFIERPFRGAMSPVTTPQLKWFAIACLVSVTSFGIYTDWANGAIERFGPESQALIKSFDQRDRDCIGKENCLLATGHPTHVVWGDSHADAILNPFRSLSKQAGTNTEAIVAGGCLPLIGYQPGTSQFAENCRAHNERALEKIVTGPYQTVFLHGRWTLAVEGTKFKYERDEVPPIATYPNRAGVDSRAEIVEQALRETLTRLSASGKKIVVIGPVPEAGWNVPYALAQRIRFGEWLDQRGTNPTWEEVTARNHAAISILQRVLASPNIHATLVLPHEQLCKPHTGCETEIQNQPLYSDAHHLTRLGADQLFDLISPFYPFELTQTSN